VTCYPGKRLIKDACIPLLTETDNLRYLFAVTLEGEIGPNVHLFDLMEYFKNKLVEDSVADFESFYIISNLTCNNLSPDVNGTSSVRLLLFTTFNILSHVHRLELEERLLNMTKMKYEIQNYTFHASLDQEAFFVPSMIHKINRQKQCFILNMQNILYFSDRDFRYTVVSNLMLCRQINLEINEFEVDENKFQLTIKHSKSVLHYEEFFKTADGKVRICVEDFIRIRSVDAHRVQALEIDNDRTALNITTLVCTILSLTCLFLTFVTYMLFKTLRSIPGINNMCLVFAMFFAHALFQFGFEQTEVDIVCKIIGVVSHFFWLSTFGCMSVCSFHMYNVFTNITRSGDALKNTIIYYIVYSYGIPAIIICVNIIIIISISDDQSIGYGETMCFLSNRISFFLTFLSPVVIVCCTNVFFFVKTSLYIRAKPDITSNKENKNNFVIYIKLFSITGITWLLIIVDTLFPISAFSFIVAILNGCQSLFIFISFVCNKRVISLYKNAKKQRGDSITSRATKATSYNLKADATSCNA